MKYAYILGSNAYVSPHGFISYNDGGQSRSFLAIRSVYHDNSPGSRLSIDLDIKDMLDRELKITDNQADDATGFHIAEQRDRVLVTKHNGDTIIDIHQLDDESAMRLAHNVIAELEVNTPVAVIRVRGDFMLGDMHIEIDNEKLFVNGNSYANSVLAGENNLQFATEGVVI
jgi:hypothetical protein